MFDSCSALSDITLDGQIKSINIWAFRNTAVSDITLPASLNTIHPGAFVNCSKLGIVEILNPLVGFTSDTFESCSKELVIKGYTGSSAEYNAKYYGLEFESIGDVPQIPFTNVIAQWTGSGYDVNISQLNADAKTYIITAYDFEGKTLSTKIGVLSDMYTSRSFYYEFGEISGFKVMIWNTLSDMIPITSVALCRL